MIIHVFHTTQPLLHPDFVAAPPPHRLVWVAAVKVDHPGQAFERTNTVDRLWWTNEGVIGGCETRSTSIGDVIQIEDDLYVVTQSGYRTIDISLPFVDPLYKNAIKEIERLLEAGEATKGIHPLGRAIHQYTAAHQDTPQVLANAKATLRGLVLDFLRRNARAQK